MAAIYELIEDNIINVKADAIVNSANTQMVKGSGICKSIFEAAGENNLLSETIQYAPLSPGTAVITKGYNLPAKYIIHTVTPKYYDYINENSNLKYTLLSSCYVSILKIANSFNIETLAIPCLGNGHHGWPLDASIWVCFDTLDWVLGGHPEYSIKKIIFVCYDERQYWNYISKVKLHQSSSKP